MPLTSRLEQVERVGPMLSAKARYTAKAIGGSTEKQKEVSDLIINTSLESFFPPSPEENALLKIEAQRAGTLPPTTANVQAMIDGMNRAASSDVEGVQVADHGGFPALEVNVTNLNGNGEPGMEAIEPTTWQALSPDLRTEFVSNDPLYYSYNRGSPNDKSNLVGTAEEAIDSYLVAEEGRETVAYSLYDAGKSGTWKSGITVGTGYDIGQHSVADINALNISEDIKALLIPYANMRGEAAHNLLSENSLVLTDEQVAELDAAVASQMEEAMRAKWDESIPNYSPGPSSTASFDDLTWEQKAVVGSLWHQRGATGFPSTLGKALDGDWDAVATELRDNTQWTEQPGVFARNARAADLLDSSRDFTIQRDTYSIMRLNTSQIPVVTDGDFALKERAGREFNAIQSSIEQEFAVSSMAQAMLNGMENAASSNVEGVQVAGPVPPGVIEKFRQEMDPIPEQNREAVLRAAMFSALNPPPTPEDVMAYIQEPYKGGGPMDSGGFDVVNINRPVGTGIAPHVIQQMDETDVWDNPIISDFNTMQANKSGSLSVVTRLGAGDDQPLSSEWASTEGVSEKDLSLINEHRANLINGTHLVNEDGTTTTVNIVGVTGPDGRIYNVPGYDGENRLTEREAALKAEALGWGLYPSYATGEEANAAAQSLHTIIEEDMSLWMSKQKIPGAPHTGGNVDFGLETVGLENTFTGLRRDGGGREMNPGVQEFIDDISAFLGDVGDSISDLANTPFQEGSTIEGVIAAADRPGLIEDDEGTATVNFFGKLGTFPIPTPSATMARNKARVNAIERQLNIKRWDDMSSRDSTFGRPLPVEIKAAAAAGMFEHTFGMNSDRFQDREGDMMERINPANPSEKVDVTTFMLQDGGPERPSMPDYSEDTDAFIADALAHNAGSEALHNLEWMDAQRKALGLMSREDFLAYSSATYGTSEAHRLDQELVLNSSDYVPRPWYGEEKPSETFWNMWAFFSADGALLTDTQRANDAMGPLRLVLRALERQKGQGGGFGNR